MEFMFNKLLPQQLDKFLAEKTITDVDRTRFIPFVYRDGVNKLTTCLMFNCNCHSYEDPTILPCEYTGAVIHLPAFWVEVPKELAFNYLLGLIKDLYTDTYYQWYKAGLIGGINTGTGDNTGTTGCTCPCINDNWQEV